MFVKKCQIKITIIYTLIVVQGKNTITKQNIETKIKG